MFGRHVAIFADRKPTADKIEEMIIAFNTALA
jgi:hypothetical protein